LVAALSVPAPEAGEMVQVTPEFEASFCTVAVNVFTVFATTLALSGETETTTAARFTV
jgi:hypothetical protein